MKLDLGDAVGDVAVGVVKSAGRQLASSKRRVKHRSKASGPIGGRLLAELRNGEKLVDRKRWGATIRWSQLGPKFLFVTQGTKRQVARPVDLVPSEAELRSAVLKAAERHARNRQRRRGRR